MVTEIRIYAEVRLVSSVPEGGLVKSVISVSEVIDRRRFLEIIAGFSI